ncbi:MAG: transcriptional repressor LexA, partial [Calditrichaeota bacterium]|nr:transcriptional repressor LexA [Calditrichota bacterium]
MKEITPRQKAVLEFIAGYITESGYPPTFQEIADAFGIVSKHGVVRHLEALERKGYITRSDTLARSIRIIHPQYMPPADTVQVPLIGRVAAGHPVLAEENIENYVMLPRTLVKSEGRYFALRVQGDSMINAGILDGDMVIVQSASTARNGDIVVALVQDEVTVKRLVAQDSQKFLKA